MNGSKGSNWAKVGPKRFRKNRYGPQFSPEQEVQRRGHVEEIIRGQKMPIIRWINDNVQNIPKLSQMLIYN